MHYITIFGSARIKADDKYYKAAYELAKNLAKQGYGVITGGSSGIMEAANKGAYEAGGKSIGINIKLPHEQITNQYCTLVKISNKLSERKLLLIEQSCAFIIMPGGFGTLDEAFEVLVLACTELKKAKIIFYGREFWAKLVEFMREVLLARGMINELDFSSFALLDSSDEVLEYLRSNS